MAGLIAWDSGGGINDSSATKEITEHTIQGIHLNLKHNSMEQSKKYISLFSISYLQCAWATQLLVWKGRVSVGGNG